MHWNEFRSHIGHFSAREQQRVHEAFELGERKHGNQKRKSGEPYFTHPIAVADMLADAGADADTVIAALLHDTIEDTDLTLPEINEAFNGSVSMLIEGVTKLSSSDVAGQPNMNEQIETLRKMFTLMEKDVRIMVIKLLDRLHNMQTAEFLPEGKRRALAQETYDIYVKIADRLCMQDIRDELEGLCLSVLHAEEFRQLTELRTRTEMLGDEVIRSMQRKIQDSPPRIEHEIEMQLEPKRWESLQLQNKSQGQAISGVSDLTMVFVCVDVDACYRMLGMLHQLWRR